MIKTTANGEYFVASDPSKTFKTYQGAGTHQEYIRITGETTRPDSRNDVQKMTDEAWRVPMSTKPEQYAAVEASIRGARNKVEADIYKPGLPIREVMLKSLTALRFQGQTAEDNAAEAAEWAEKPLIKSGLIEAKRLLEEAENDYTRDRAEVVKAEQLIAAMSTPGADEAWIRSQLKTLLGVEGQRIAAARESATAQLAEAQSKVNALASAQRVVVRVPVPAEGTLLERGNTYTASLMSAGADHAQLDAAFKAMDAAFAGDMSQLAATLAANEGSEA